MTAAKAMLFAFVDPQQYFDWHRDLGNNVACPGMRFLRRRVRHSTRFPPGPELRAEHEDRSRGIQGDVVAERADRGVLDFSGIC
jgi:hypothetical protein